MTPAFSSLRSSRFFTHGISACARFGQRLVLLLGLLLGLLPALTSAATPADPSPDFNGDKHPDFLWQDPVSGERAIWLMNSTSFLAHSTLGIFPLEWTIAAAGDFNADGKPDLVWSNSLTGERALWLLNGTSYIAASTLGVFPLEWTVAATGDFNADGKPDLVWSNSLTGERALWLMNGTNFLGVSTLGVFPHEWTVAATGDFNSDGKIDIVWSNSLTGERALWLMDGTNFLAASTLGIFPLEWTVIATGDFNADGKPDLVWSNSLTGERALWLMNGTTFISSHTINPTPAPGIPTATLGFLSGTITLTRSGGTSAALPVSFTLGGTAVVGTDYTITASPVTIPAGAATTNLVLAPTSSLASQKTLTITIAATAGYNVDNASLDLRLTPAGLTSVPPANPILYVTQVPISGFVARSSAFGNHNASMEGCPRGGDLMIRYPDGSLRNLTQEAGYGMTGFQGANAIAVREPCVHWSGTKALFSMVIGAPPARYNYASFYWQLYEVTGLGQGQTVQITKIANQPANYNNISPVYASDGRIIFTTDRPRNGQRHLYPQLDEYESAGTVTGVWSLQASTGDLRLLTHTPSGAFNPLVDTFGRVLYTRWDHLQQDQQADADRASGGTSYGSFTYADESATAAMFPLGPEVFPEPRDSNDPVNVARHRSGNAFNLFMPWQINQDGTEEETLNHVGRHEITNTYRLPIFLNDSNLSDQVNRAFFVNRTFLRGADGGMFFIREDPTVPGTYWGIHAPEFGTDGAGQIVKLTGSPTLNAEQMVMTAITDPVTAFGRPDATPITAAHVGLFRSPLPLTSGGVIAAHSPESRVDTNEGNRNAPDFRYDFRLRYLNQSGPYATPGTYVTTGTSKSLNWWDPDEKVTYSGPLWELDPVEVVARAVPPSLTGHLQTPEQQVLAEEGVNEAALRQWLATNNLALIVTRNNTIRDRADVSQPFNLRVPGGITTAPNSGKVYDIAHLQLIQADQVRGYGGMTNPRLGRRVLGQFMHDPAAQNPANPNGPAGSVKLGADGSSAAFVPARRAMSWQLTDTAGEPVVVERNWVTFQPGEIRTCAGCHGANSVAHGNLASPTNKPEALRELLRLWKTLN